MTSHSTDALKDTQSCLLFATPWTVACTKLLCPWDFQGKSTGWSGLPFPSPGNLPNPGIEPRSLTLYTDALPSKPPEKSKDTSDTLKCTVVHMSQKVNTT